MGTYEDLMRRNGKDDELYGEKVNQLVREKYTISAELSILRQRDTKPEEFEAYNDFVEECKKKAKGE